MTDDFYIDSWLIQPSLNRISSGKEFWRLEPKIMSVLICLAKQPGQVITREYIFKEVWGETIVVDMTLTRAISELRSIFKDSPKSPRIIETIPKRGYRLIGAVSKAPTDDKYQPPISQGVSVKTSPRLLLLVGSSFALLLIFTFSFTNFFRGNKTYQASSLTSLKGWEFNPSISPDGNTFAFVWQKPGESGSQIVTRMFGKENSTKILTHSDAFHLSPTWSPDGNTVAFYVNDNGLISIKSVPAFGGEEELLIELRSQVSGLSWSPNGDFLAFVAMDSVSKQHVIYSYSFASKHVSKISSPPSSFWGDAFPRFSNNGKNIAFIRSETEGKQDIYSIDLRSGRETRITEYSVPILGFDWENENNIIFSASFDGAVETWRLSLSSNTLQKLPIGKNKHNPFVNKGALILEDWAIDTDLYLADLVANDESISLSPVSSTLWELHPEYSKKNGRIAFSSNRSGSYEIWTSEPDGSGSRKLTSMISSLNGMPSWSPAGDVIAFDSRINGASDIYIIDDSGSGLYQFTKDPANDISASWSRDGSFIYFSSNRSGNWEIWKKPINGDQPSQITFSGGYYGAESYDGKILYFTKPLTDGVWSLDLTTKKEHLLFSQLQAIDWGNWELTKDGIYFLQRSDQNTVSEISFYNFSSADIHPVLPLKISVPVNDPSMALSPNENHVLIGQTTGYKGDLLLVEDF